MGPVSVGRYESGSPFVRSAGDGTGEAVASTLAAAPPDVDRDAASVGSGRAGSAGGAAGAATGAGGGAGEDAGGRDGAGGGGAVGRDIAGGSGSSSGAVWA